MRQFVWSQQVGYGNDGWFHSYITSLLQTFTYHWFFSDWFLSNSCGSCSSLTHICGSLCTLFFLLGDQLFVVLHHVWKLCTSCWSNEIAMAFTTSEQVGIVKMLSVKYRVISIKQSFAKTVVKRNVPAFSFVLNPIPALHHVRWVVHPTVHPGKWLIVHHHAGKRDCLVGLIESSLQHVS